MDDLEVQSVLRRVGYVLVVVGLLDIGQMIYCIVRGLSYHSSFNIFAVIAGIFLIRGSLRAAGIVLWSATFMLTGLACGAVALPLLLPVGLVLAELRQNASSFGGSLVLLAAVLALLYWVTRQLRPLPVMPVRIWRWRARTLRSVVASGAAIIGILAVLVVPMLHGQSAKRAIGIAASELGPGYHYYVISIRWTSGRHGTEVSAVVTAWNRHEIRDVPVHWRN
jgi:hypothetical protein